MSSVNYMFTVNNYTSADVPCGWKEYVQWCVWQEEVGEQGTPHLQGTLVLKQKRSMKWMQKNLLQTHYEVRRGTAQQAKEYCTKTETRKPGTEPYEYGEMPVQGKRSDLNAYKAMIEEGKSEREVAESDFGTFARYPRLYKSYKFLVQGIQQRDWVTELVVYWGPPGTGKTRRARYEAGDQAYWLARPSSGGPVWFDGYEGQETVVIDEFYGWISRDMFCRLADRYPYQVPTKGGTAIFLAKKIIVTSNTEPEQWWKCGLGPVERRMTIRETMFFPVWQEPPKQELKALPLAPEMGLMCDEILPPAGNAVDDPVVVDEVPLAATQEIAPIFKKRTVSHVEDAARAAEAEELAIFWAHPDMQDCSLQEGQRAWEAFQSWKRARYQ